MHSVDLELSKQSKEDREPSYGGSEPLTKEESAQMNSKRRVRRREPRNRPFGLLDEGTGLAQGYATNSVGSGHGVVEGGLQKEMTLEEAI